MLNYINIHKFMVGRGVTTDMEVKVNPAHGNLNGQIYAVTKSVGPQSRCSFFVVYLNNLHLLEKKIYISRSIGTSHDLEYISVNEI